MRLSCVFRYASFYKRDAAGFSHINTCASGGFHFLSSWVECTPVEVQGRVSPLSWLDLPPLPYMELNTYKSPIIVHSLPKAFTFNWSAQGNYWLCSRFGSNRDNPFFKNVTESFGCLLRASASLGDSCLPCVVVSACAGDTSPSSDHLLLAVRATLYHLPLLTRFPPCPPLPVKRWLHSGMRLIHVSCR